MMGWIDKKYCTKCKDIVDATWWVLTNNYVCPKNDAHDSKSGVIQAVYRHRQDLDEKVSCAKCNLCRYYYIRNKADDALLCL